MRLNNIQNKKQLIDLIAQEIRTRLPPLQTAGILEFVGHYLEMLPLEEVQGRRLPDIYGAIVACWQFLQHHDHKHPKIVVFNPDLEVHGWQSTHTVITVLHHNVPFIVDSLRMALNRMELKVFSIQYAVLYMERDQNGDLEHFRGRREEHPRELAESLVFIEIDRHNDEDDLRKVHNEISQVLKEVRVAVSDYDRMKANAIALLAEFSAVVPGRKPADIEEVRDFLQWLTEDHFTFLGYDEYEYQGSGKDLTLQQIRNSELGILREKSDQPKVLKYSQLPQNVRKRLDNSDLIIFSKSPERSRVHRPAYPDCIAVRKFNDKGEVTGERRFLGLYTARVYQERPEQIPFVRRKVAHVLRQSGFNANDYAGKELDQILAVYPRDELFQTDQEQLHETAMAILYIQERRKIRLFLREDIYGQFVNAMVYIPREIYSTDLRLAITSILVEATGATDVDFTTYFSESVLARTQLSLKVPLEGKRRLNVRDLESKIVAAAQSWQEGVMEALNEAYGEELANTYSHLYANAFSASYREKFSPRRAVVDIGHIASLTESAPLSMSFYRALEENEAFLHFKLFRHDNQVPLSDVLPLFENLGLRVIGEHPYQARDRGGRLTWIHDFSLQSTDGVVVDIQQIREHFEELFHRVWRGEAENDVFNRLVVTALMDWREIAMFRAYARYMRQIRFSYSQDFIAMTLVHHVGVTKTLQELFEARFNPACVASREQCDASQKKLELEINEALEGVDSLSEDRVLRRYVELIKATVRTNYYQTSADGKLKSYMSFKLRPMALSDMPLPLPMFEIFVYSPQVEGVHLRGGKVARGGLRWSDRFEDYRTEVLGLVKAQQVKNSVIVPVGAKGGFVARQLPESSDRENWLAKGIDSYKTFVRGLLDVTDNLLGGQVAPPEKVIRHDDDDFYLVVAADKGTATFSDIANGLSAEYGFWLGDAFASGGSQGYDHKKMGITAKGAWVSVRRHFSEIGLNTQTDDFSVIGIGDMSGDVFGNGMLLSEHIQLVAAFNHQHIFVDPSPQPDVSFAERRRLFNLPRSTWADYDSQLISAGGGIFARSQKSIPVSAEMKLRFGIKQDRLPPNMLINAILKAKADLLWIGGIGTYVKSSDESHVDVGDKANDAVRINGCELNVKVVGEGGNLGMTQLGRVEYAMQGGRLNTDFIDNAGGVDCSDHEVNIKILLNEVVASGDMTLKQRNKLLVDMTESVAELVLLSNYKQTLALSNAEVEAPVRIEEYRRMIGHLESIGKLNRALEFIPDDETITDRKARKMGLMRPELCVLISYIKGLAKEELMNSDIVDDDSLAGELSTEFPLLLQKKFAAQLGKHRLRREIIATQLANNMVNHMGITFVERLRQSTGATLPSIAYAYVIARDVYQMPQHWAAIEALDYKVSSAVQKNMMLDLMRLVRRSTRWFLRNRRRELNVLENMGRFSSGIVQISQRLNLLLSGDQLDFWQKNYAAYSAAGVPEALANTMAGVPYLYSALGIIEAQEKSGFSLDYVAEAFFRMGETLDLQWFAYQLSIAQPASHWQALARESFREDLDWQQRSITAGLLSGGTGKEPISERIAAWKQQHAELVGRWQVMLTELKATKDPEFPMYSVALRELLDIAQASTHLAPV
jgi:glutamate dehydrogenase